MNICAAIWMIFFIYREFLGLCLALGAVYITEKTERENAANRIAGRPAESGMPRTPRNGNEKYCKHV